MFAVFWALLGSGFGLSSGMVWGSFLKVSEDLTTARVLAMIFRIVLEVIENCLIGAFPLYLPDEYCWVQNMATKLDDCLLFLGLLMYL